MTGSTIDWGVAAFFAALLLLAASSAVNKARAETIEDARRARGLPHLAISGHLAAIAHEHAADMARRRSLDHDGFHERRGPAGAMAENVSWSCRNATCAIERWLRSPPHRANILLRTARSYGVASANGLSPAGRPTTYWAMEIGP